MFIVVPRVEGILLLAPESPARPAGSNVADLARASDGRVEGMVVKQHHWSPRSLNERAVAGPGRVELRCLELNLLSEAWPST